MLVFARFVAVILLLGIVSFCAYAALAAFEAWPEERWAFWILFGVVGLASLLGIGWLIWPKRPLFAFVRIVPAFVLLGIAGFCAYIALAVLIGRPKDSWAYWIIVGVPGLSSLVAAAWLLSPKRQ